jgi:hypothetical protein
MSCNIRSVFCCRRPYPSLVVEVSRQRYGGRLVSLHSCVQLVNSTALPLQLGCVSGPGRQPLPLEVLGPGESVWLPLQVGGFLFISFFGVCVSHRSRSCRVLRCVQLVNSTALPLQLSCVGQTVGGVWPWRVCDCRYK